MGVIVFAMKEQHNLITATLKATGYCRPYSLKVHYEIYFVVPLNSSMVIMCKQELMFMHDCNDIHYVATNVLLTSRPTQQIFIVLFFLVEINTLGSKVEPGLATNLCAQALCSI